MNNKDKDVKQDGESILDKIARLKHEFRAESGGIHRDATHALIPLNMEEEVHREVQKHVMFMPFLAHMNERSEICIEAYFFYGMKLIFTKNVSQITILTDGK